MSILDWIPFFDSLTQADRDTLTLFCQERFVKKGEILFREGDDANALYIVKSGSFKAFKERSEWENLLGYIHAGDLIGEMAIFDPGTSRKRMANIQSLEDSMIAVILDYAIVDLSKKQPEVYEKIAKIIQNRKVSSV